MSMSISSAGYSASALQNRQICNQRQQRPDPEAALHQTFTTLDAGSKGYLDKADLDSALSGTGDASGDSSALFTALDGDEDGKITEEEMSSALKNMFSGSDRGQFAMRMAGSRGMNGMAPPPPPPQEGEDAGFSVDELSQMASDLAETDSQRAAEFETLAASFDEADTDGNGKLTRDEAMGFLFGDKENETGSTAPTTTTTTTGDDSASLMRQIMALMKTYGAVADTSAFTESLLSLSA